MAEVSEGRVRERPRLGWIDGVKVALGKRVMTAAAESQCAKDRKERRAMVHMELNEFHAAIFALPCVLLDPLLWYGGYCLEALSKLLKCEGGAGYLKLVASPILLVAPPILMVLPYVSHQMLNFILI